MRQPSPLRRGASLPRRPPAKRRSLHPISPGFLLAKGISFPVQFLTTALLSRPPPTGSWTSAAARGWSSGQGSAARTSNRASSASGTKGKGQGFIKEVPLGAHGMATIVGAEKRILQVRCADGAEFHFDADALELVK